MLGGRELRAPGSKGGSGSDVRGGMRRGAAAWTLAALPALPAPPLSLRLARHCVSRIPRIQHPQKITNALARLVAPVAPTRRTTHRAPRRAPLHPAPSSRNMNSAFTTSVRFWYKGWKRATHT